MPHGKSHDKPATLGVQLYKLEKAKKKREGLIKSLEEGDGLVDLKTFKTLTTIKEGPNKVRLVKGRVL